MFKNITQRLVKYRKKRLMTRLEPLIDSVLEWADQYRDLGDEDFPAKTDEFIYRIKRRECGIKEQFIRENASKAEGGPQAEQIDVQALSSFRIKKARLMERFIDLNRRLIESAGDEGSVNRFISQKREMLSALPARTYRFGDSSDIMAEHLTGVLEWEIGKVKWREGYSGIVLSNIEGEPSEGAFLIRSTDSLRESSEGSIENLKRRKARSIEELLRAHDVLIGPDRENAVLRDFKKRRAELRKAFSEARGASDDDTREGAPLLPLIESEKDASTRTEWLDRYYEAIDNLIPVLIEVDPACEELRERYFDIMDELIPDLSEVAAFAIAKERWAEGERTKERASSHCDLYASDSTLKDHLLPILGVERNATLGRKWLDRYGVGVSAFMERITEFEPLRGLWERQHGAFDEDDPAAKARAHEFFIDACSSVIVDHVPKESVREFLDFKNAVKREFIEEGDHLVRILDQEQRNLVFAYSQFLDELLPDVMNLESDAKLNKRWRDAYNDVLDGLLPEAYGLVYEACRRLKEQGRSWQVWDDTVVWHMVPFRVQIAGAIVLHRGSIAEMATGEGKTLVATMPLYLNALTKKGACLVTVNDYLARRDAEWMGGLYRFLGVSVGYLQQTVLERGEQRQMTFRERKQAYGCDITYGTNNEFGFDYLRDNMKYNKYFQVQTSRYFAIVDEVDSVLIDEARTPLIISDVVTKSKLAKNYYWLRNDAKNLVQKQGALVNRVMEEVKQGTNGTDRLGIGEFVGNADDAEHTEDVNSMKLLLVQKGDPKNRDLAEMKEIDSVKQGILKWDDKLLVRAKNQIPYSHYDLDELLYFVIDERGHSVKVTQKGRENLSARVNNFAIPKTLQDVFTGEEQRELRNLFSLPDLSEKLQQIDLDADLSAEEKMEKKDELHRIYADKNEAIQNFYQLLKAYVLFSKDVDYIVQDSSVIIVDEFTGRLMPGRRYSDGLHQALEAKENVGIERETQTVATITLQNYFKMFSKLSGMTGTAATEEEEFLRVYDLDVNVVPTNKPVRRVDYDDVIYRTKDEKRRAIVEEVVRLHENGLPVLIGTVSVQESERLSNMLKSYRPETADRSGGNGGAKKRKDSRGVKGETGISHNVLNARHHKSEAQIIAEAGQPGAVTIATNMAGRGTDIRLGEGVVKCERCCIHCEIPDECDTCPNQHRNVSCMGDVPCGLHVIGTERHESRRIDLQLRGRAGRQGDPGASRFFISLEDDLMRLIGLGSRRVLAVLDGLGAEKGQVIEHPMITRAIARAQKHMEKYNFGIRENLVKFDNVMNKQRELIYTRRNEILLSSNPHEYVLGLIREVIRNSIDRHTSGDTAVTEWELDEAAAELSRIFRASMVPRDVKPSTEPRDRIVFDYLFERAEEEIEEKLGQGIRHASDVNETLRETAYQYFLQRAMERFEERKKKLPLELMVNKNAFLQISSIDPGLLSHRQKGQIPLSIIHDYEKLIMLKSIDDRWRDHLYEIDNLKEAIHLRSYGGKDVIVEFQKEAYELFMDMLEEIDTRILSSVFDTIIIDESDAKKMEKLESMMTVHEEIEAFHGRGIPESAAVSVPKGRVRRDGAVKTEPVRKAEKIGRNDPCPCGSGKKYKKCCGSGAN